MSGAGRPAPRARGWLRASWSVLGALTLGALALGGCSSSTRVPPPFVFNSPGDVELVCFDTQSGVDQRDVVLPWACCVSGSSCTPGAKPIRHGLVTQTSRGEVAAVDLENAKVLDSERRVPGYTFVDVGGLPTAIVVPPRLPGPADAEPEAPAWTYVAGREVNSVRAVATCRFRVGKACGPEPTDFAEKVAFRARTEVLLPEAPQDMLLDPDGAALWVSLPKAGLLARIELGSVYEDAFALDEQTGMPRAPTYFELASGVDLTPPEPAADTASYVAVCGVGYAYQPLQLQLPIATRADSSGQARPTRMKLVRVAQGDGQEQPLLLVSDVGQNLLHAFSIVDGALEQRAVLAVGAPLGDFALTPAVPAGVPDVEQLSDPVSFAYAQPPTDERRYLYGIDARDGSLMAFAFSQQNGVPELLPLLAPVPMRNDLNIHRELSDRLAFDGVSARALDVVDTRNQDASYCGEIPVDLASDRDGDGKDDPGLKALIKLKKSELSRTHDSAARAALQAEIDALNTSLTTTQDATSDALRGVFVIVASSSGSVTVLDVHDLNLQCRARLACVAGDPVKQSDDTSVKGLAVQRHAPRVLTAEPAVLLASSLDDLQFPEDEHEKPQCLDGYYLPPTASDTPVCAVADPWQARDQQWAVRYQGRVAPVPSSVLEPGPEPGQLIWRAPAAFDLCARGANADDDLTIAITAAPSADVHGCDSPTSGHEPVLHVEEAYADHLLLARLPEDSEPRPVDLDELLRCYPEFVGGELRLNQQYLVTFTQDLYLHRNRAEEGTGRCVADERIDPLLSSRAARDRSFRDPWIAFTLALPPEGGEASDVAPAIELTQQSSFLRVINIDSSSGRSDALPSRVRFFGDTGDLFVVDGASQGLRRYTLVPFAADSARFR